MYAVTCVSKGSLNLLIQIGNIVVRSFTGNPTFIKDIATIEDTHAEKQDFARLDHKTVVTLNVIKRSGENLLNATDKIYETIDDYKATQFPQGLNVQVTGDTSELTRVQLHDLINTVIIGFILVVFVLMFFMGFRNAFFVGLAVPLSCLIAFSVYARAGTDHECHGAFFTTARAGYHRR
jgi:multidrug efflux pump subunit AcrB